MTTSPISGGRRLHPAAHCGKTARIRHLRASETSGKGTAEPEESNSAVQGTGKMGRKSGKTKGGRMINPADALRKEMRKKEIKKVCMGEQGVQWCWCVGRRVGAR